MKLPLPSSSTMNNQTVMIRKALLSPLLITIIALIIIVTILYGQDNFFSSCTFSQPSDHDHHPRLNPKHQTKSVNKMKDDGGGRNKGQRRKAAAAFSVGEAAEGCDIFSGRWVRDRDEKPMYEEWECPYIQPQLTCQEHGRPDRDYQFWRWQPHGCDLPKFNASMMLEALRGKRMLYVGDSLNRGQYVSMICLLHKLVTEDAKSMESSYDSLTVFRLKEYNATIEFYWAPFLLESNSDNAVAHRVSDRIVRKASINAHGNFWKGADIIVFNTYLWWMTGRKMKILKGTFKDEMQEINELETEDAYRMAMKSMVKWVQRNMDPKKTRIFFTSMSPTHTKSIDWGGDPGGNCYNETTPIKDPDYWDSDSRSSIMKVIEEEFNRSKVPISFLNITQLSSYRKDAHTQIYKKQWSALTPEQLANPRSYADCVHWCLPGLQDTWNELLFAKLFYP